MYLQKLSICRTVGLFSYIGCPWPASEVLFFSIYFYLHRNRSNCLAIGNLIQCEVYFIFKVTQLLVQIQVSVRFSVVCLTPALRLQTSSTHHFYFYLSAVALQGKFQKAHCYKLKNSNLTTELPSLMVRGCLKSRGAKVVWPASYRTGSSVILWRTSALITSKWQFSRFHL